MSGAPSEPANTANIRSLADEDSIYRAFDSYPWTKDETFKSGLNAILGSPESTPNPGDVATHARIFYYTQRIGVAIDFASYQSWLADHPDHIPPQVLPREHTSSSQPEGAAPLSWQSAAPKTELFVDKSKVAAEAAASGADQPSYPMAFAEMIKLLQEGKTIPGIRQIPNTLARDPSVKPVGSRQVPRKPWEKDNTESSTIDLTSGLATDFPPLDEETIEPAQEGVTSG